MFAPIAENEVMHRVTPDSKTKLEIFEAEIPQNILIDFYCMSKDAVLFPKLRYQGLFKIWKKMRYGTEICPILSPTRFEDNVDNDLMEFDFCTLDNN
jgi:hypothetical protein